MPVSFNPLARTSLTVTPNPRRGGWILISSRDVCQYHCSPRSPRGEPYSSGIAGHFCSLSQEVGEVDVTLEPLRPAGLVGSLM